MPLGLLGLQLAARGAAGLMERRKREEARGDLSGVLSQVAQALPRVGNLAEAAKSGLEGITTAAGGVATNVTGAVPGLAEVVGSGVGAGTAAGTAAGATGAATGAAGLAALGACWVADELYGPQAKRTHLARLYAQTNDTWFLRKYKKHGVQWAQWLKHHSWAKPLVRPIWDGMAFKGALIAARWGEAQNG